MRLPSTNLEGVIRIAFEDLCFTINRDLDFAVENGHVFIMVLE